ALKHDPQRLSYLYQLAEVTRAQGNEAAARKLMREYAVRTELDNKAFELNQRIKQDSQNPELRLRLARLYAGGNNLEAALFQYNQCLLLAPDHPVARQEMAELRRRLQGKQARATPGATH